MEGMKHYGWGIVDKDGKRISGIIDTSEYQAQHYCKILRKLHESARVVELFYKEEQ